MKTLLLIPLLFLVSCSTKLAVVDDQGQVYSASRFDRFANNGRDAENMQHSFALLEKIQQDGDKGQLIFWETGGREYFHAMRKIGDGVHQGPNPSLGYYTSRREVVNVDGSNIPWSRILGIKARS
jgi:hypothetical protein